MNKNYSFLDLNQIAKEIIRNSKHKILLFHGEMGVGKTTLIKEICKILGTDVLINSPTFSLGFDGKEVWLKFKNNGAKVVKAELIYTKNGGVKGEIWFPVPMKLIGNKVCVKLPKGTTHYVFNLVDENNYLISYPDAGYQKTTKIFATKAIAVK